MSEHPSPPIFPTSGDWAAFHQALINSIPCPLYYKNLELRYCGCNTAFATLFSLSPSDMIGKTVHDLTTPDQAQFVESQDRILLQTGKPQEYEVQLKTPSGKTFDILIHKHLYCDASNTPLGIIGSFTDLTPVKAVHNKLSRLKEINSSTHSIHDQLVHTTCKEVRQHLLEIQRSASLLLTQSNLNSQDSQTVKNILRISRQAFQCSEIFVSTTQLLKLSPEQKPHTTPATTQSNQPLKLLLVEDDRTNQQVILSMLKRSPFLCTVANDGIEAINLISHEAYDIILMDIQMPRMDGIKATQTIRAMPPPRGIVPIIALTANNSVENKNNCIHAGMNSFLCKPVKKAALLEALTNIIQQIAPPTAETSDVQKTQWLHSPVLNKEFLDDLKLNFETDDYITLISSFTEHCENTTPSILKLIDREGWEELYRIVHQLKGSSGNVGGRKLNLLCGEICKAYLAGNFPAMREESLKLPTTIAETCTALEDDLFTL